MAVNSIHKTDIDIISLLKAGAYEGWEHLYNKYSPLMYGTIMREVNFDKPAAEAMLVKIFLDLKHSKFFGTIGTQSLSLCLVQHCYQVMSKNNKTVVLAAKPPPYCAEHFPLMQATMLDKQPLQISAAKLGITEALAMERLRSELQEARKNFLSASSGYSTLTYNNAGEISS